MAIKAKQAAGNARRVWVSDAVFTEGSPVLLAGARLYAGWSGAAAGKAGDYQRVVLDGGVPDPAGVVGCRGASVALVDTEGGRNFDVGVTPHDVVLVDIGVDSKRRARLRKQVDRGTMPEFFVGELDIDGGIVIADSALNGVVVPADGRALDTETASAPRTLAPNQLFVARPKGHYVLLEGALDDDDDGDNRWFRLVQAMSGATYDRRPPAPSQDKVEYMLARMSFASPVEEARALEIALELIALGRPDLAIEASAKASDDRKALANWTRILALAAQRSPLAEAECRELTEWWLAPADSTRAANQMLLRAQIVRALDSVLSISPSPALSALRARVVDAPEPTVFLASGDGDFF